MRKNGDAYFAAPLSIPTRTQLPNSEPVPWPICPTLVSFLYTSSFFLKTNWINVLWIELASFPTAKLQTLLGKKQAFARQLYAVVRDSKVRVYTYSLKRSRTRTFSASATSCKRPTVTSCRPFIHLLTVCRLTPIWSASHWSLTFFSSSPCAGSTATQIVLSLLFYSNV